MSFGVPENTAGVAQHLVLCQVGQEASHERQVGDPRVVGGQGDHREVELQLVEAVARGVADEGDSVGERIGVRAYRCPAGQPDDVRPLRGQREQFVAVARDEDRHVGGVLVHVLGDVTQPLDALTRGRVRQLGLLELLLDVSRPEAEVEATAAEITQRCDVTGQQRGPVEPGVEHEGADAKLLGRHGHRRHHRERRRRIEMVGHVDDVVSHVLRAARPVLNGLLTSRGL